MWFAPRPSELSVTRVANGCDRISSCMTLIRVSSKYLGTYITILLTRTNPTNEGVGENGDRHQFPFRKMVPVPIFTNKATPYPRLQSPSHIRCDDSRIRTGTTYLVLV